MPLVLDGAADLFDVPRDGKSSGLVWFLSGEAVPEHAMTESGQMFDRLAMPGDSIADIEHA